MAHLGGGGGGGVDVDGGALSVASSRAPQRASDNAMGMLRASGGARICLRPDKSGQTNAAAANHASRAGPKGRG